MPPNFGNFGYDPEEIQRRYWERRRQRMWARRQRIQHAGMVPAIILIAIGAVFFLNNLHIFYFRDVLRYWPVVLIVLGLAKALDASTHSGRTGGAIVAVIGAVFLAPNLGIWDISMGDLWPLFLIGLGALLLVQRVWLPGIPVAGPPPPGAPPPGRNFTAGTPGTINEGAFFSGGKRRIVTPDFHGGEVSCIFGGFDLDFRKAGISGDSAVLVVNAIFGGCDIKVPESWDVVMEAAAVFGGCDDRTVHPNPSDPGVKRLFLRGSAIFGGIDVKN